MPETTTNTLPMPGTSWELIKRIIRGYQAAQDEENPTVESVGKLAGMQRSVVSANNVFLRSTKILEEGQNKLTLLGARLATGLAHSNQPLIVSALQDIVRGHAGLSYLANIVRARGEMPMEGFRGEIIVLAGLAETSRNIQFLKSIVDLLVEAQIIDVKDDLVRYRPFAPPGPIAEREVPKNPHAPPAKIEGGERTTNAITKTTVPIMLGIGRFASLELPDDWSDKDLPKLLKLIKLSLGEESEESKD